MTVQSVVLDSWVIFALLTNVPAAAIPMIVFAFICQERKMTLTPEIDHVSRTSQRI